MPHHTLDCSVAKLTLLFVYDRSEWCVRVVITFSVLFGKAHGVCVSAITFNNIFTLKIKMSALRGEREKMNQMVFFFDCFSRMHE